jgi:hypothetical protein
MSDFDDSPSWWLFLVAGAILTFVITSCPRDRPNTDLARTAREAVELAQDAQADNQSAVLWSGRLRLLALVIGVSVPLLVVYLLWRTASQGEVSAAEVLECVDRYALPDGTPMLRLPMNTPTPAKNKPQIARPKDPPGKTAD